MKMPVVATALALSAGLMLAPLQGAQAQTTSKEQTTKKQQQKPQKRTVGNGSPYSTNPAHDVYVNGVYVGSDPDPRIRWTLKREYCSESVDGCGY